MAVSSFREVLGRNDPDSEIERIAAKHAYAPELPRALVGESDGSIAEGVAKLVHVVANTWASPIGGDRPLSWGGEAEVLSVYHRAARRACSARYAYLRNECMSEGLNKEDLNRDSKLQELNGIRIGFRRAMHDAYERAPRVLN